MPACSARRPGGDSSTTRRRSDGHGFRQSGFRFLPPHRRAEHARRAVRDLADAKIAPRAAAVDETAEFPYDVREALVRAEFHAVHVPEQYGGVGADAVSARIVVEEIARACASSSLIPAVNKLGSMPIILAGSEDLKKQMLTPLAAGDAMFSYALSEREAGSDAASMRTRAVRDRDSWILNGTKAWITNAGSVDALHGDGGDRIGCGAEGNLGIRGPQGRPGVLGRS